jgi:Flp pilus assembly protein TadD
MNYARLNLSSLYNAQQRNQDALRILQEAERTDPKNGRVHYQLGLLLAEMKQVPAAEEQFRKAIAQKYDDPRLYYNYGIIVQQQGRAKEAEQIFRAGLALSPEHEDLNYALAFLMLQLKRDRDALQPGMMLKKINPNNPDYRPLFERLRI